MLGQRLLACADESLLALPLDRLSQRVKDDDTSALLQAIHEAGEADCLRDLLDPARLTEWATGEATTREAELLHAQLQRWLGVGEHGADDPARLATVTPLPTDIEAMIAWARPYDLLGELTRPAHEVLPSLADLPTNVSLVQHALGHGSGIARGKSLLGAQQAQTQARDYLMREAARHAALGARESLWRSAVDDTLRPLNERLRALIGNATLLTLHAFRFVPARAVSVDIDTGVTRGHLHVDDPRGSIAVKLWLSGYEQRALHAECELCHPPGIASTCVHVRVLAARLLDACLDVNDRLHAPLLAMAEVPSWKRFLHALKLNPTSIDTATQRLFFGVQLNGERVVVRAVQQQRQPNGTWTEGRQASPLKLLRARDCAEQDRPVLEAMALISRTASARPVTADIGLLRSLVEHPFVRHDDTGDAIRISEQNVDVALIEQPEGLLPRVSLSGARVAVGDRARDASYLIHHNTSDAMLVFSALTPGLRRLLAALANFHGVLPAESYSQLAPWLASLRQVARVTTPTVLRGTERPAPTKLLMRITPGIDQGIDIALMTRALPMAPLWPPGQGPELAYSLEDGRQVFARRDLHAERDNAKRVIETLALDTLLRLEPFAYRIEDNQTALALLSSAARLHEQIDIEWAERARQLSIVGALRVADLKIELFQKGQWFTVEGGARHAAADIAIGRLLDAVRRGERFVVVNGRDHLEIEQDLFERLQRAQLCTNESVREPSMSTAAAPFWNAALGTATQVSSSAAPAPETPLPEAWNARLRSYQKDGVARLIAQSTWAPGACLADEMGLGKTVQAIALLEARAALGPALVIAPTSVVNQWCEELARFAPSLKVHLQQSRKGRKQRTTLGPRDVVVISYDVLLRDQERLHALPFATQIVDEAQMVKNARTQRAQAVAKVNAQFTVALSGTPIENRLADLWSLFQLVAPGLLGSWARFRARFAVPIERYENAERAAALRQLVAPFILRRTKNQVALELPSRTEVTHMIELSPAEQDLYAAAVRQARRSIGKRRGDNANHRVQILAELTKLRQLACHPRLVIDDERLESSKLHALMQLLDDILPRGHRALIFSQFTRHLALVQEALQRAAVASLYLDGATPAAERTRLVKRFQQREAQVFLISLKAGGTGLNLTAADYVVHLDPWWNPAAEDQASDRAHRIGQTQPLTIVKLVSQGTIEEKVLALHGQKRRLAEAVLAGDAAPNSVDLEALL